MRTDCWDVLSDWHDTWLAAAPDEERAHLRASFATEHPDLLQMADEARARIKDLRCGSPIQPND